MIVKMKVNEAFWTQLTLHTLESLSLHHLKIFIYRCAEPIIGDSEISLGFMVGKENCANFTLRPKRMKKISMQNKIRKTENFIANSVGINSA